MYADSESAVGMHNISQSAPLLFRTSPVSDIFEQSDIKNVFSGFNGSKIR